MQILLLTCVCAEQLTSNPEFPRTRQFQLMSNTPAVRYCTKPERDAGKLNERETELDAAEKERRSALEVGLPPPLTY